MKAKRFKVEVVWKDGEEEFVAGPNGDVAIFPNYQKAEEVAENLRFGMDEAMIQSINIVKA